MFFRLFLLFTLIPILELTILFRLSGVIGLPYTIGIVAFTGIAGAYLAKSQGNQILSKIKWEMHQGRMPGDELINGLCVLIGGAFLITPGILTDVTGFILVIPFTREIIKRTIKTKMKRMIEEGNVNFYFRK